MAASEAIAKLSQQLKDDWYEEEEGENPVFSSDSPHDVSSLAINLTTQTEYNNHLLRSLEDMEKKYHNSEGFRYELIQRNQRLEKELKITIERCDDLENKLHISSGYVDELSIQFQHLRKDVLQSDDIIKKNQIEFQTLKQRNEYLEELNTSYSQQVISLESQINDLHNYSNQFNPSSSLQNDLLSLKFQLSSLQTELDSHHQHNTTLSLQTQQQKEEIIQLNEIVIAMRRKHEEDMIEVDKERRKSQELTVLLRELQQENVETLTALERLQHEKDVLHYQLQQQIVYREEAVVHSHETDQKWRELEELVKKFQHENEEYEQQRERDEERIHQLEERVQSYQERDREWERSIREDCERSIATMKLKLEELTQQLRYTEIQHDEDIQAHNKTYKTATRQIEELNQLLSESRKELLNCGDEVKRVRKESEARQEQLEKINQQLREERKMVLLEEREGILTAKSEVQKYREKYVQRGDRCSLTLSLTHDAIHAIGEEAAYLKSSFHFLSTQQDKLAVILKHYTERQAYTFPETNDSSTPPSRRDSEDGGNPLNPLEGYGREIRKTLEVLISKIRKLHEENDELRDQLRHIVIDKQEVNLVIQELEGKLSITEEKLAVSQGTVSRLEKQWEDNLQTNRELMGSVQHERTRASSRYEQAENKVNELIKQNTISQTEIRKLQSETTALRKENEDRSNVLLKKIKDIEQNRDSYLNSLKQLEVRYSELQNEKAKADERNSKQQQDYQKLKTISLSLKDDLTKYNLKHQEQIKSLSQALDQYRIQLEQKQQIIETLQTQRVELIHNQQNPSSTSLSHLSSSHPSFTSPPTLHSQDRDFNSRHYISSSSASSSASALSGLAQLVHSSASHQNSYQTRRNLTTIQPSALSSSLSPSRRRGTQEIASGDRREKEIDIGVGAYHSSLKHITAAVNQMTTSKPFRTPALKPQDKERKDREIERESDEDIYRELLERYEASKSTQNQLEPPERNLRLKTDDDESSESEGPGIFRLTSPTKRE